MSNIEDLGKNLMDLGNKVVQEAEKVYSEKIKPFAEGGIEKARPFIAEQMSKAADALANASERMHTAGAGDELTKTVAEDAEATVEKAVKEIVEEEPQAPASEKDDPMRRFNEIKASREQSDMITDFFHKKN